MAPGEMWPKDPLDEGLTPFRGEWWERMRLPRSCSEKGDAERARFLVTLLAAASLDAGRESEKGSDDIPLPRNTLLIK